MKWTPWLFGSLTAVWIAGCGGDKRNTDTGAAMDTSGMSARSDTGRTGSMNSDSARTGSRMHKDTTGKSSSNQ